MAYIGTVEYDESGSIRTLEGLGEVSYDNGARRNLSGAPLGAVKYDDGGRFRTLFGMGQADVPTDLPLPALTPDIIPLEWSTPTPNPIFDTQSAPITGTLVDTSPPISSPGVIIPTFTPTTESAPITGNLTPPSSAGTLVSTASPTVGVLDSLFNSVKNIFSSVTGTATPVLPATGAAAAAPSTSWFSGSTSVAGLSIPNWGVLAVGGVAALALLGGSGGGGRRRNPRRKRNGMELVLMGANPRRGGWLQSEGEKMRASGTQGSFSREARRAGYSTREYARIKYHAPGKLGKRARFAYVRERGHGMR